MSERFLYQVTPQGKIHFSYGVSHTHEVTTIRVDNTCNILGLSVENEGWEDGIVRMDFDGWNEALAAGRICKKCLDGLDRAHNPDWIEMWFHYGGGQ